MINIVTIGGGKGQSNMLSGLKDVEGIDITSIVSMVDSGGSTGELREKFDCLPPGDILKCILALSDKSEISDFLLERFTGGKLNNHNPGNMLLSMMAEFAEDFNKAAESLCGLLEAKGVVLPVTQDKANLVAELEDGSVLFGEDKVDTFRPAERAKIKRVYLEPCGEKGVRANSKALEAIEKADYIILSPGDLYTSLIPNLIVEGVGKSIQNSKANLIYVCNLLQKTGETDGYKGEDFISTIDNYLGRRPDFVISAKSSGWSEEFQDLAVDFEKGSKKDKMIIEEDLALITEDGKVKHDPAKLAQTLSNLFFKNT